MMLYQSRFLVFVVRILHHHHLPRVILLSNFCDLNEPNDDEASYVTTMSILFGAALLTV